MKKLTLEKIDSFEVADQAKFMGQSYTIGTQAFEKNDDLKKKLEK